MPVRRCRSPRALRGGQIVCRNALSRSLGEHGGRCPTYSNASTARSGSGWRPAARRWRSRRAWRQRLKRSLVPRRARGLPRDRRGRHRRPPCQPRGAVRRAERIAALCSRPSRSGLARRRARSPRAPASRGASSTRSSVSWWQRGCSSNATCPSGRSGYSPAPSEDPPAAWDAHDRETAPAPQSPSTGPPSEAASPEAARASDLVEETVAATDETHSPRAARPSS